MRKLKNEELNRKSIEEFKASEKLPLYIVLDNIRSLNNIGSVFRSSDAFLVKKVFLCGITATPPHKDIQKTALGATDAVDWAYENSVIDLIERLQEEGVLVLAIEQAEGARSLLDFIPEKNKTYAVVLGNEVLGVQQTVVDLSLIHI